ncbi:hypothetical protein K8M07_10360 [Schnuerera sp. xch1]|uniref:hypothetical protein n=1 Tax=Schnuerera sp. xch1 TaxID=2874283 RepID=UPI001CC14986|nr:hypothetical protein [Schnuerera sp. xch1]MBZ2175638.1 hypothetical protein [Schnuerera sp. xch1]
MFFPIRTIIFLIVIIGVVFLQIFLSKKQSKWFGLILPIICLLFSLIAVLSVPAFFTQGELTLEQIAPDGTVIEETITEQHNKPIGNIGTAVFQVIVVFLLYNIPTAILLVIYFACRENLKKRSLLDKMNIQDLE